MDNYQLVQDKKDELSGMYDRMDRDRLAFKLNKYTLTGFDQFKDKEIPRTVSVTMNDARVYANAIIAVLQGAKRQTSVEGVSDTQAKLIENFIDDCMYTADQQLRHLRKINSLWDFICWHVAITGPIGAQITFDQNGRPQVVPFDMRWCPHEPTAWYAPLTRRSNRSLRAEYKDIKGFDQSKIPDDNTEVEFTNFWDGKINEWYIDDKKIFEQENIYKTLPSVIEYPSAGSYDLDKGYIAYWAESIFESVRDLYPSWNQLMSVNQTIALSIVKPPYVHQANEVSPPQPYPDQIATNTPYAKDEKPELLQRPDLPRAFQSAVAGISDALHKGSPSMIDLADTAGVRNASWITEQTEVRDRITVPRTSCLQNFMSDFYTLACKLYQTQKFIDPAPLGRKGVNKQYDPASLGDPDNYTIEAKYMPENKRQNLANYAVAKAMEGILSKDTIVREIVQSDDPDGELDKLALEEAEQSNPIIFYYNKAARMIDVAQTHSGDEKYRILRQAKVMADSMVKAIKDSKMTQSQQGTQQLQTQRGSSQPLMALPALTGR
jgi:hypothetical protein